MIWMIAYMNEFWSENVDVPAWVLSDGSIITPAYTRQTSNWRVKCIDSMCTWYENDVAKLFRAAMTLVEWGVCRARSVRCDQRQTKTLSRGSRNHVSTWNAKLFRMILICLLHAWMLAEMIIHASLKTGVFVIDRYSMNRRISRTNFSPSIHRIFDYVQAKSWAVLICAHVGTNFQSLTSSN